MAHEVQTLLRASHPESGEQVEVRLAACGARDRGEQALLFNRCFRKRVDERALRWRYDESPHGPSVSWLARPAGSPGVSGYACTPRRVIVSGDDSTLAPVGQTGDVMTDPDWRQRGLFSALDRAAVAEAGERGFALAFGLPNRKSAPIFEALGWEVVGSVRPWTCVLRADPAASAARSTDGRLAALTTPWAAYRGAAARRRLASGAAGIRAEPLQGEFPADVLEVARSVEPRFRWMGRRDAEWLTWRFLRSPSRLHRVQLLRSADGALEGYVVVQQPRPGEGVGYLVDLLARSDAGVDSGLAAGLDALARAGASVAQATAIDGSWWRTQLERAGFRPPRAEKVLSIILYPLSADHALVAAAREPARWYFTDGDRDDETMG